MIRKVITSYDNFSAINAIIILYFLRWVLHFHSSGLLGLVRFQALVLRLVLLLFLLGGGLVLTLFQRLFAGQVNVLPSGIGQRVDEFDRAGEHIVPEVERAVHVQQEQARIEQFFQIVHGSHLTESYFFLNTLL